MELSDSEGERTPAAAKKRKVMPAAAKPCAPTPGAEAKSCCSTPYSVR